MRILILLMLTTSLFGWEHSSWLKEVKNRTDKEAISWLQDLLKEENKEFQKDDLTLLIEDQCKNCFKGEIQEIMEPKIYVFMSFSVPDNIWLSLSKEMADYPAVFLLRGLPNNSFKSLAQKIAVLKEKGMEAPIQIFPQLFKQYSVEKVPCFVFCDQGEIDKFRGSISIDFASDARDKKELSTERG